MAQKKTGKLISYAKKLAWLNCNQEGFSRNRIDVFGVDSDEAKMPDVSDCEYILDMFMECGVMMGDGSSLSYGEIESWSNITGMKLTPYEAITIRSMSCAYSSQMSKSRNTQEQDPCFNEINDIETIRSNLIKKKNALKRNKP